MNKKVIAIVVGIIFVCVCLICSISLLIFAISDRENKIQSNGEAAEILDNAIQRLKTTLDRSEKVKATSTYNTNDEEDIFAIDPLNKEVFFSNGKDHRKFILEDRVIECSYSNCRLITDDDRRPGTSFDPTLLPYDDFLALGFSDDDGLFNDGMLGYQIDDGKVTYKESIDCDTGRCYVIRYGNNEFYTTYYIDIDSEQLIELQSISKNESHSRNHSARFEYQFEIDVPVIPNN